MFVPILQYQDVRFPHRLNFIDCGGDLSVRQRKLPFFKPWIDATPENVDTLSPNIGLARAVQSLRSCWLHCSSVWIPMRMIYILKRVTLLRKARAEISHAHNQKSLADQTHIVSLPPDFYASTDHQQP